MEKSKKKNPKNAGRKRKYSDNELLKIIELFLQNDYKGDINASILANFAKERLGYLDIKYYHFTQQDICNKKIQDIKSQKNHVYIDTPLQAFININIDTYIGQYIKNPLKLRDKLYSLQCSLKETNENIKMISNQNEKFKRLLKKYQEYEDSAKSEIRILRQKNNELIGKVKMLKSLIEVDNQIKIYKYIADKTIIDEDIAEQYITTLLKCKVVKKKDFEEIINELKSSKNNEQKKLSDNLIQLFNELNEKNNDEPLEEDDFEYISMDELNDILDD